MKLSLVIGIAIVVVAAVLPRVSSAQEAAPPPPSVTTQETTTQATGPSMVMVGSGFVIVGLSYLPAVVVAATSGQSADRALFVPVAGPWIDLTQRPGCPSEGSCNTENTAKVLIVADGVFQAIGVLTILGGLLATGHETKTVQRSATLNVTPARIGVGGYGMVALGTF